MKKSVENDNIIIRIEEDTDAESPRNWDNLGTMACWHRRYNLGDKHSYSEPREFLEDLVEGLQETEIGKKILQKKLEEDFSYEVVQNEEETYIFIPKRLEFIEEFDTLEDAKDRLNDKKAQMISDEYAEQTLHNLEKVLTSPNEVMESVRKKVDRKFTFSIIKKENKYFMADIKHSKDPNYYIFADEEFDTKEQAEDYLEKEKENWIKEEAIHALSYSELTEIIGESHIILPIYAYEHGGITLSTGSFSCPWDSGQVGWIYATKERFIKETGYKESELFETDKHRLPVIGERVKLKGHEEKGEYGFGLVKEIKDNQVTVDFDYNKSLSTRKSENVITVTLDEISEVMSERAKEMLEGEVEIYDQYLQGNIYGFVIEKKIKCECCNNVETEEIDSCWGFYGNDPFENGMSDHIDKEYHELLKELA